jgi:hypothetical protein
MIFSDISNEILQVKKTRLAGASREIGALVRDAYAV